MGTKQRKLSELETLIREYHSIHKQAPNIKDHKLGAKEVIYYLGLAVAAKKTLDEVIKERDEKRADKLTPKKDKKSGEKKHEKKKKGLFRR